MGVASKGLSICVSLLNATPTLTRRPIGVAFKGFRGGRIAQTDRAGRLAVLGVNKLPAHQNKKTAAGAALLRGGFHAASNT